MARAGSRASGSTGASVRWSAVRLRIFRNMGVPPMLNAPSVRRIRVFEQLTDFQIACTGETPVSLEKFSNSPRTNSSAKRAARCGRYKDGGANHHGILRKCHLPLPL